MRSEKLLAFESMAKDLEPMLQLDHVFSFHSQVSMPIAARISIRVSAHVLHAPVYANAYAHVCFFVAARVGLVYTVASRDSS